MKAKGTLLMALPYKDQLKFHSYQEAKLLMEAIKKRALKNQDNKGREYGRKTVPVETLTENALIAQNEIGWYNWSYQAEEEILTNYAFMALTSSGSSSSSDSKVDSCSKSCMKAYANLKEEYDRNYMPFKRDLRLIDEHFKSVYVDVISNIAPSDVKTVKTIDVNHKGVFKIEKPKPVMKNNFSPPIIEDWHSDDESEIEISPTVEDVRPMRNNSNRVNHKKFANKLTHPHPKRGFVPQAVLTRSGKINTAGTVISTADRPVNTAGTKSTVNHPRLISKDFKRGHSHDTRPYNKSSTNKSSIFNKKVNTVRVNDSSAKDRAVGNPQYKEYKEKGVIDSGCSRHMTGNKCYLTDFEAYDGGFVSFGDGKGRISEAVNTACYVLNRALVTKPHNKTSYKLICGRPPLIDFMKPFGCHVTILNTEDNLGKFERKADEGYFVGYSVVSKAMRVFNKRTNIVEETLNIRFQENAPNVKGNEPDWLFDIDSLTISMNYVPVVARNQTNGIAGSKENLVACQDDKKKELKQEYILIPICTNDLLISQGTKDSAVDVGKKAPEVDESEASDNDGKNDQVPRSKVESLLLQERLWVL
nr:ribonuclease H-like domain-containing protein [Tanacetum cinerariifolium]